MPNYWRARINPRVARGKLRVLHDGMGQRRSASPPNPCVLVALCQIEREGLRGDEPGIDSGLFPRRRMAPKDGVIFPTPAVKQLPRSDGVGCLAGGEWGRASNEYLAIMRWLWCVWLLLGESARCSGSVAIFWRARIGAAPALTIWLTTNSLFGTARRGQKRTSAVKATAGLAHSDSSGFEMKSLRRIRNPEYEQEKSEKS